MATLAKAALSDAERRTLERLVEGLRAELGDSLRAVWLYGSRARGAPRSDESDIDLLAITDGNRGIDDERLWRLVEQAAGAEGTSAAFISAHMYDVEWLAGRRAIDAFFIQEVDRDKVVLAGDGLEEVGRSEEGAGASRGLEDGDGSGIGTDEAARVSARSQEYLDQARTQLREAQWTLQGEFAGGAVSSAYMAMLNATRAALSEENRHTRTHRGTWHLFHDTFVRPGRFNHDLHARAQKTQPLRETADYGVKQLDLDQARELVDLAERFLSEVELLLERR